jgi:hypothetical protein
LFQNIGNINYSSLFVFSGWGEHLSRLKDGFRWEMKSTGTVDLRHFSIEGQQFSARVDFTEIVHAEGFNFFYAHLHFSAIIFSVLPHYTLSLLPVTSFIHFFSLYNILF